MSIHFINIYIYIYIYIYICKDNQNKNYIILKHFKESLIDLRNSCNIKEIPPNENRKKVVNIVENILDFNKQQKGKISTLKRRFQRLPRVIAQTKAGNTSENLLNETR